MRLLALLFAALVSAASSRAQLPAYDFTAARNQLAEHLDLYGPGVCAVAELRGAPLFSYQSGLVRADTKLAIASCSKWLSGAIVLILAERGYFDLNDRIGLYLPEFDAVGKGTPTIRQCFAMTSGLVLADPDYEIDRTLTLAESVDQIAAHTPIVFPPGTQLAYEGDGMQVVGRICEVVTGKPWTTLANELLFGPLGMTSASYDVFAPNPAIAGGVRCTADDYLKFLRMVLRNGIAPDGTIVMSSRSAEVFFRNQTWGLPEYASPWPPSDYNVYGHRGDYGCGSWILAQQTADSPVEEVCSPGAFGSFPWVDRKRGICGVIFTLKPHTTPGFSATQDNNLHVLALLRAEIDARGLPAPGPESPITLTPAAGGYLRLDWTGGGVLETSIDLVHWDAFPLMDSPFAENTEQLGTTRGFYRLRR
ncbi:MAG TPA: serine hydrolase domain-containing protein [Opitutaceae bacterium]|nr:serine hydrolase domain-containing protein [Opitutaceae bacterium]